MSGLPLNQRTPRENTPRFSKKEQPWPATQESVNTFFNQPPGWRPTPPPHSSAQFRGTSSSTGEQGTSSLGKSSPLLSLLDDDVPGTVAIEKRKHERSPVGFVPMRIPDRLATSRGHSSASPPHKRSHSYHSPSSANSSPKSVASAGSSRSREKTDDYSRLKHELGGFTTSRYSAFTSQVETRMIYSDWGQHQEAKKRHIEEYLRSQDPQESKSAFRFLGRPKAPAQSNYANWYKAVSDSYRSYRKAKKENRSGIDEQNQRYAAGYLNEAHETFRLSKSPIKYELLGSQVRIPSSSKPGTNRYPDLKVQDLEDQTGTFRYIDLKTNSVTESKHQLQDILNHDEPGYGGLDVAFSHSSKLLSPSIANLDLLRVPSGKTLRARSNSMEEGAFIPLDKFRERSELRKKSTAIVDSPY